jgi:hypothetical protein
MGTSADIGIGVPASAIPYQWIVKCVSPQGTQTTQQVTGRIRRVVSLGWEANTSGNPSAWQNMANGGVIAWAINGPFDQRYSSTGADACMIESFGYTGAIVLDPENPNRNLNAVAPPYNQTRLWSSGDYPNWPVSYEFARFYFGDPMNSPYGFAPFNGYKWKLTCAAFGDDQKTVVMYGRMQ